MRTSNHDIQTVLESGLWHLGVERFASGKQANNKLEMPEALRYPPARALLLDRMGQVIVVCGVRVLWSIPTGGDEFADALTQELGLEPPIRQRKDSAESGKKTFAYATPEDEARALAGKDYMGVEDLTSEFTSTDGALQVPGLRARTLGIVAAWRRGSPKVERAIGVPVDWAIEAEVPNMLTPNHPFWRQWGHLAVGDPNVIAAAQAQ